MPQTAPFRPASLGPVVGLEPDVPDFRLRARVTESLADIGFFPSFLLSNIYALLENLWSTSFDQSVGMESISSLCWLFLALFLPVRQ